MKKNQPTLYKHLDKISLQESEISNYIEKDNSHGRKIKREASVFEFTGNNQKKWDTLTYSPALSSGYSPTDEELDEITRI